MKMLVQEPHNKKILKHTSICLKDDVFEVSVILVVSDFNNILTEAKKHLSKKYLEILTKRIKKENTVYNNGETFTFDGGNSLIWIRKGCGLDVLVHEITHATHWIFQSCFIRVSMETTELYAYYNSYLFKKFSPFI